MVAVMVVLFVTAKPFLFSFLVLSLWCPYSLLSHCSLMLLTFFSPVPQVFLLKNEFFKTNKCKSGKKCENIHDKGTQKKEDRKGRVWHRRRERRKKKRREDEIEKLANWKGQRRHGYGGKGRYTCCGITTMDDEMSTSFIQRGEGSYSKASYWKKWLAVSIPKW